MHIKRMKLVHFRKFDEESNVIELVSSQARKAHDGTVSQSHIASSTTLVIGKNNVGKSTVVQAVRMLMTQKADLRGSDFCFPYLARILKSRFDGDDTPYIEIKIEIGFEGSDSIANLEGFVTLGGSMPTANNSVEITARYAPSDEIAMLEAMRGIDPSLPDGKQMESLLKLIDESDFGCSFLNANGTQVKSFRFTKLIAYGEVPATDVSGPHCLTNAFNKIMEYQAEALLESEDDKTEILKHIGEMNDILTNCIGALHGNDINEVLKSTVRGANIRAQISADITLEKVRKNLVRYDYDEDGLLIPEDQFGLGYTRLVMVIAHILDYVDQYDDDPLNGKAGLIVIEEPETHMHPQMQELFIQYIEDTVNALVKLRGKSLNCQLVITTHSDHIVHSKIHAGGKFDCVNYLREENGTAVVIPLNDKSVQPSGGTSPADDLKFLKKHVCLSLSSIFFADVVVIVEGPSELSLLPYYIAAHEGLRDKYVSIVSVNGAHAFVYEKLIEALGIPSVIITDLDIIRDTQDSEDGMRQITSLEGLLTTNATLKHFAKTNELDKMEFPIASEGGSIQVFSQCEVEGYYPTSFEEAEVLANYGNDVLVGALLKTKPMVFGAMLGDPENREALRDRSYECQRKLSDRKSDFAGELLYGLMTADDGTAALPLPRYIADALDAVAGLPEDDGNA